MLKSKFESLEFLLFANPQLHGSPVSEENCSTNAKVQLTLTVQLILANSQHCLHLMLIKINPPKGSKDYTLTGNSPIQKAPTKSSSSEIGSVPNMNNRQKSEQR